MIKLRQYQLDCIKAIWERWKQGIRKQLIVLPTGTGKTIIFATLTKELNKKTLIIAHTEELIQQAVDKIRLVFPTADIGVCKAERNEIGHKIVVGSIQSIRQDNRLQEIKEQNFSLLIVDEAHHAAAESYLKVISELGFMQSKDKLLVGFTATPKRGDGEGLNKVFQEITYKSYILRMIKVGYLADVKCQSIKTEIDISEVGTARGDFISSQLASVVNTIDRNKLIVKSYREYAEGTKAVAFCVDVQHSKDLATEFNRVGIKAKAVYGSMPLDEREKAIQAFKDGEIQILTNCMVLTEGFDVEGIQTLLLCRPTKSEGLFIQMVGRGLRIYPGKEYCLVLDFADNSRHKLCSTATLLGKEKNVIIKDGETILGAVARTEQELKSKGILKAIEVDLLERSPINWIKSSNGNFIVMLERNKYIELSKIQDSYEINLHDNESTKKLHSELLPLDYAQGIAEDYIRGCKSILADRNAKWRKDLATENQIKILKKNKKWKKGMKKGEASDIITFIKLQDHSNTNHTN